MANDDSNAATRSPLAEDYSDMGKGLRVRPFVKWAGGKSQILNELTKRVPRVYKRYWEPFVGGGALFFYLKPAVASISDTNEQLVETYKIVRDDVEQLIIELGTHPYDKDHYYQVREWDRHPDFKRMPALRRAARLIYLNKTCFNGLHRVNSSGHFNVPFGDYTNPTIVDAENLRRCSEALQAADITLGDYGCVIDRVDRGDFVYLDPPYVPLSATSSFTAYTSQRFSSAEQEALCEFCHRLHQKGVMFMLSNSASPVIERLYSDFRIEEVRANRAINSKASKRGAINEFLVTNY